MVAPSLSPQVLVRLRILLPDFAQVHIPIHTQAMSDASSTAGSSGDLSAAAEVALDLAAINEAISYNQALDQRVDQALLRQREANENNAYLAPAEYRGVKRSNDGEPKIPVSNYCFLRRQQELEDFYHTNPGEAPVIIPGCTYYLFAPGLDPNCDLANPGFPLGKYACSYNTQAMSHTVRVMLKKKCFQIIDSPPPTEDCSNAIAPKGHLTIGWRGDVKLAWYRVLEVLEAHALAQKALANQGVLAAIPEHGVLADEQMAPHFA